MKNLSGGPFWGRLLALPTNNRLGWKRLPGIHAGPCLHTGSIAGGRKQLTLTNTLAYYIFSIPGPQTR